VSSAGPLAEQYHALRHGVGGRLVGRDVLRLSGPDAASYLHGQCSQDVVAMEPGETRDALLLSPQGKLEALVRVLRAGEDAYLLDVEGGWGPAVAARLARFKLRVKADLEPLSLRCLALRGPGAPEAAASVPASWRLEFSWNGVRGVDLFAPALSVPAGVSPCGVAAWEALRVEAGIPAMGAELDERTIAAEAGLVERCVSFTKGCYTGQELVARLDARGNKVARRLVGLVVGHPGEPGAQPVRLTEGAGPPLERGTVVEAEGTEVGRVTSSAFSPVLGVVALGYLHRRVPTPAPLSLRLPGGQRLAAEARALPLVGGANP
jgi:folate-binding protein YgfZ